MPFNRYHEIMRPAFKHIAFAYFDAAQEVLLETFWPTRCVICDRAGALICDHCHKNLSYIDHWQRCKRCGASQGLIQCTECNRTILKSPHIISLPYRACVSVTDYDEKSARIISCYKDQNEQRLSAIIAHHLYNVIPPIWFSTPELALSYVPASSKAYQRRGFDHAEALCNALSDLCGLPTLTLFERPLSKDQRMLGRNERIENMQSRIALKQSAIPPRNILLIDDVYTTGATLCAASMALRKAGVKEVLCATFARV